MDKYNCAEIDECSTGAHGCDVHADCINTLGSYHCVCQHGYAGNGYKCERKSTVSLQQQVQVPAVTSMSAASPSDLKVCANI